MHPANPEVIPVTQARCGALRACCKRVHWRWFMLALGLLAWFGVQALSDHDRVVSQEAKMNAVELKLGELREDLRLGLGEIRQATWEIKGLLHEKREAGKEQ